MVLVEVDGNFIDAEPMKSKSEETMIKAYHTLWAQLTASGSVKPKTHLLDNKASTEFKRVLQKKCAIQLVPPDNHRQNIAKKSNLNFQDSLQSNPCRSRQFIPNETVGQTPPSNNINAKSSPTIQCSPNHIRRAICTW